MILKLFGAGNLKKLCEQNIGALKNNNIILTIDLKNK